MQSADLPHQISVSALGVSPLDAQHPRGEVAASLGDTAAEAAQCSTRSGCVCTSILVREYPSRVPFRFLFRCTSPKAKSSAQHRRVLSCACECPACGRCGDSVLCCDGGQTWLPACVRRSSREAERLRVCCCCAACPQLARRRWRAHCCSKLRILQVGLMPNLRTLQLHTCRCIRADGT